MVHVHSYLLSNCRAADAADAAGSRAKVHRKWEAGSLRRGGQHAAPRASRRSRRTAVRCLRRDLPIPVRADCQRARRPLPAVLPMWRLETWDPAVVRVFNANCDWVDREQRASEEGICSWSVVH